MRASYTCAHQKHYLFFRTNASAEAKAKIRAKRASWMGFCLIFILKNTLEYQPRNLFWFNMK